MSDRLLLLVLAFAVLASAQPKHPASVFPSDAQPAATAGAAELLEAVCPGGVIATKAVACKGPCPARTGFGGASEPGGWSISAVTFGHFLSPASDDAALAMVGCEPHAANWGGTVLLTRQHGHWDMRWYKSGVMTDQCHKVTRADGRDLLVCLGGYTGQGVTSLNLWLTDLTIADPQGGTSFFNTLDSTGACGGMDRENPDPVVASSIDKLEFLTRQVNGLPSIAVAASFGKKTMTPAEWQSCTQGKAENPPLKTYPLEFQFDGHNYMPTAASAAAAKMFEAQ